MSAMVFPPFQRKTLAWCEQCQDGVRTTKAKAQTWADKHNTDKHSGPKPMWEAMDCPNVTGDDFYEDFK